LSAAEPHRIHAFVQPLQPTNDSHPLAAVVREHDLLATAATSSQASPEKQPAPFTVATDPTINNITLKAVNPPKADASQLPPKFFTAKKKTAHFQSLKQASHRLRYSRSYHHRAHQPAHHAELRTARTASIDRNALSFAPV